MENCKMVILHGCFIRTCEIHLFGQIGDYVTKSMFTMLQLQSLLSRL